MKHYGWLLFLVLMPCVSAAPINLTNGELYNFSYVNVSNTKAVQDFFCSNATIMYNITNVTVYNWTNITSIVVNVTQGETRNFIQNNCNVTAFCVGTENNGNVCSVDTSVRSGELYTKNDGACNIKLQCKEDRNSCTYYNTTVQFQKSIKLTGDQGKITFSYDGEVQEFKRNATTFNYETTIDYTCPVQVTNQTLSEIDLLSICKETNPFLVTWVDAALKKGWESQDKYVSCIEQQRAAMTAHEVQVSDLNGNVIGLQTTLNSTTSAFNQCVVDKGEIESRQYFYVAIIIMSCIWAGGATIMAIILGMSLWKLKRHRGEDE